MLFLLLMCFLFSFGPLHLPLTHTWGQFGFQPQVNTKSASPTQSWFSFRLGYMTSNNPQEMDKHIANYDLQLFFAWNFTCAVPFSKLGSLFCCSQSLAHFWRARVQVSFQWWPSLVSAFPPSSYSPPMLPSTASQCHFELVVIVGWQCMVSIGGK